MRNISIAIVSRNTFLRVSLMAIINDLIQASDGLNVRFTCATRELTDQDIIITELLPGEIHLCNLSIKNRKKHSSVIILHRYDVLPEKSSIVNCLKDVTFVALRTANVAGMADIIAKALKKTENPTLTPAFDPALICANCPHKTLSPSQVFVAHGLMNGFDIRKISALHQITPKVVVYHKNQIMEKYGLNNHSDFFQFIHLLKERG
ncbi:MULTISPECIES: helix-turn-helix transcriptional regulator [Klebsiella]|uniref:helix-turn-helix transcriptional regulator n=1 Tax=Klebsiella TaxID=570 RepID=UPI0021ACC6D9|nr:MULTISPECIES: transcriptional regulator [Klebsiella]UVG23262.1 transcriptional regulator [Klebsiella quasipneumoniae]HCI5763803.1 transcriptional regulator [Klebsiella quasipneumoniae subsp. quasipneumoniae]HDT2604697.1 transcriptional regulator [Klebsiella quasipneumoniae subsp. similipneumoniae]